MYVSLVGGARFDSAKLERFIFALAEKHPTARIVTGNGKGAEKYVLDLAPAIGLTTVIPDLHPEWFGDEALLCQVTNILIDYDQDSPLVLAGTGARVTRALEIHKRSAPYLETPRLIHEIAKVPTAPRKEPVRRARKPVYD